MASVRKAAKGKGKFIKKATVSQKEVNHAIDVLLAQGVDSRHQLKNHVHQGVLLQKEALPPFYVLSDTVNPVIEGEVFRSKIGMGRLIAGMALAAVAVATAVYFI